MRCGPLPEPEVCSGACHTDADCGDLCSCAEDRNECYQSDRPDTCDANQVCRTDEECGEGCGCVLESFPMRCGPLPESEVCSGACRTDADCGDLCSCAEGRNECY